MVKVYYDNEANLDLLKGKTVGIVGYGSQGHAHSQNLRDSGVKVIVAEIPGPSFDQAKQDGFEVLTARDVAAQADLITVTVPDQYQPQVYESALAPEMKAGKTILFAHGFNIPARSDCSSP